jgi:hypothetical protein
MRRLYLELKNLRWHFFAPLAVLYFLVPLMVLATLRAAGGGESFAECAIICQLFIPSFAVWWPLFVMNEYLNSPGKELLFVYKSWRDSLMLKMIILWALFTTSTLFLFLYFTTLFNFVWFLFIAIISQGMFLISLGYVLSLIVQNTFISLIANFAYSSLFILVWPDSPLSIYTIGNFNHATMMGKTGIITIVSLMLLFCGYQLEKRLYKNSI